MGRQGAEQNTDPTASQRRTADLDAEAWLAQSSSQLGLLFSCPLSQQLRPGGLAGAMGAALSSSDWAQA